MTDRTSTRAHVRGSVLVPVVAAMLILLLTGVGLSELFSAQRMRSVLEVESARAYWVAEAGLWHAAYARAAISPAVSFGGGSYTATKSALVYTATAGRGSATRVVTEDFTPPSPLNEAASAATAVKKDSKKFQLSLVSSSVSGAVIESFELSANAATEKVKKLKYNGKEIWKQDAGVSLPTGVLALNKGKTSERTVGAGTSLLMECEFTDDPSGTVGYTLILHFTNGSSSTLTFTIAW